MEENDTKLIPRATAANLDSIKRSELVWCTISKKCNPVSETRHASQWHGDLLIGSLRPQRNSHAVDIAYHYQLTELERLDVSMLQPNTNE